MKVLLVNEGSSRNLGDRAIRVAMEDLLALHGCDCDFCDFSNPRLEASAAAAPAPAAAPAAGNPLLKKALRVIFPVQLRWLLRNLGTIAGVARRGHDLLVIGGGQLILANRFFPVALCCWALLFRLLTGKRVVIFGAGCGERFGWLDRFLIGRALAVTDAIYLRDPDSIRVMKRLFGRDAGFVPDAAYFLSRSAAAEVTREKVALVAVTSYQVYRHYNEKTLPREEYLGIWAQRAREFREAGYAVRLFYTTPDDSAETGALRELFRERHGEELVVLELNGLGELMREVAAAELLLAGRMHALILGHQFGCRVLAFPISHKLRSFSDCYLEGGEEIPALQERILSAFREALQGSAPDAMPAAAGAGRDAGAGRAEG